MDDELFNEDEIKKELPKEVEKAKEKYGVMKFVILDKDFYFRLPNPVETKMMLDKFADDKNDDKRMTRIAGFVRSWLIYPSTVEYEEVLEEKSGVFVTIYNKISKEIGIGEDFLASRL